jgi:transcriptional regulator with XRE-family HTH domain
MADETRNARAALAQRIDRLRCQRGWTIEELADRVECDPAQLRSLLDNFPDVGVSVIIRLAGALEVGPEDLLDGIEWLPDGKGGGEYRAAGPGTD